MPTIGLKQLSQKKYTLVPNLPQNLRQTIGEPEDAFDAIIYGASGNGKTNFTIAFIKALILSLQCKCEYVSYEEGHGKTVQDAMISRHNMLEEVGNLLQITDHLSFEQLVKKMDQRKSPKIWVIDSLQACGFTALQTKELKERFVLSKKRKIIVYISWAEGKEPAGVVGKYVKYYANIKLRVQGFCIPDPVSRYGGNLPYIIWDEGAKNAWGKHYKKIVSRLPKNGNAGKAKVKDALAEPLEQGAFSLTVNEN